MRSALSRSRRIRNTELDPDTLGPEGYRIDFGNSYIQVVTWDSGGVHAEGFLTYSQSTDPANPHYADFTEAYSQKRWHRFPFHPSEIAADQESRITLDRHPDTCRRLSSTPFPCCRTSAHAVPSRQCRLGSVLQVEDQDRHSTHGCLSQIYVDVCPRAVKRGRRVEVPNGNTEG